MLLSIVIPSYNEERRLPPTLTRLFEILPEHYGDSFEILIVNDGGTDGTREALGPLLEKHATLRWIDMPQNGGRGVAVREGVRQAKGDLILETDADGSVDPEAIPRFTTFLQEHPDIDMVIGSRNIEGSRLVRRQPRLRTMFGYLFLTLAAIMFQWSYRDRINGFKMFRRHVAIDICSRQRETAYLAEAEIVIIAERRGWKYELLPVSWTDHPDSKIKPFREAVRSLRGMVAMFFRLHSGVYDTPAIR